MSISNWKNYFASFAFALVAFLIPASHLFAATVTLSSGRVDLSSANSKYQWNIRADSPSLSGTIQATIAITKAQQAPLLASTKTSTMTLTALGGNYATGYELDPNSTYTAQVTYTISGAKEQSNVISITTPNPSSSSNINGNDGSVLLNSENPPVTPGTPSASDTYTFLAPLPGFDRTFDVSKGVGNYIETVFKLIIFLSGLLAVIMIIWGGVQYMTTDAWSEKHEGKDRIVNALLGLILVLGSYVILNTINPALVNMQFGVEKISLDVNSSEFFEEASDEPHAPVGGKFCKAVYASGSEWTPPSDDIERGKLNAVGVSVNKNNCSKVGVRGCTSVRGLSDSAIAKLGQLKTSCGTGCVVEVTGGTECWLHSSGTKHLPQEQPGGGTTVDLSKSRGGTLESYVINNSTSVKNNKGWTIYTFNKGPMKGSIFTDEGNHFHVTRW